MEENIREKLEPIFDNIVGKLKKEDAKFLGCGSFGIVKEVKIKEKNKEFAGKLIEKKEDQKDESEKILEFKGPNIVKFNKIYKDQGQDKKYNLIIMEKAIMNLCSLIQECNKKNFLKLIYMSPSKGNFGDNLLRFFCKQIMTGLEILHRSDFCHFDIKPPNILIFDNMILKISDFGLLKGQESNEKIRITGGTLGYKTPEYYIKKKEEISMEHAKKQDYFALGSTLFYTKYGESMLQYEEYKDNNLNADYIKELLHKAMDQIKSDKLIDTDFIDFLCNLINFNPEIRYNFEQIYRNKWLNKYNKEILEIFDVNGYDERKLLIELNKSDYLINNESNSDNIVINNESNKEKIIIEKKDNINKKSNFNIRRKKFKFNYKKKSKEKDIK